MREIDVSVVSQAVASLCIKANKILPDDLKKIIDYSFEKEKNISFNTTSPVSASVAAASQLQVVLVKPEKFDDASGIADSLNAKKTVVLNLEATSKEVSRRLVDFLSGVAYVLGGEMIRTNKNTIVISPSGVDISGFAPEAEAPAEEPAQETAPEAVEEYEEVVEEV